MNEDISVDTTSDYNICVARACRLKTVKDYREFAERAVEHYGYRLIRFGARAREKLFFGYSKTRQYSKAKSTYFDEVDLAELGGLDFDATNVKGSRLANLSLGFDFCHNASLLYTTLVLDSADGGGAPRFAQTEAFIELMQGISGIEFVLADRMASEKWVDAFARGIGQGRRSDFENKVAYSISACISIHHKLPYLFAYNHIRMTAATLGPVPRHAVVEERGGYVTVTFPRCFGKTLDQYPLLPEWLSVYRALKEGGILEARAPLDDMVAQAATQAR
jgi:hypothetical protein